MLEYASNNDVSITIPHEYNGNSIEVTDVEYELLDASGTVLIEREAATVGTDGSTVITLPASANMTTEKRDVRQLNAFLTTAEGTFNSTVFYTLAGDKLKLTPLVDSFMTFPESILVRARMAEEVYYFDALTDELKAISLENAFIKLKEVRFKIGTRVIEDISEITLEDFNSLLPDFLLSLKKAQIAEANIIVEQSPVKDKIRLGIISETIGESSMFFNQNGVRPTKLAGISDEAFDYISKYIYKDTVSAQIWKLNRA